MVENESVCACLHVHLQDFLRIHAHVSVVLSTVRDCVHIPERVERSSQSTHGLKREGVCAQWRPRVEVAKGLMGSSPPSVIEPWMCCSLHTLTFTLIFYSAMSAVNRHKIFPSAQPCSSNPNSHCMNPKHGNLWVSPSYARTQLAIQNLLITQSPPVS